jgi:hypothetical protein
VGGDVSVDSESFLVTDFMNLKIKSAQSFECAHRDMMYIHVFIRVSTRTCINIYIYTVFQKKYTTCIKTTVMWLKEATDFGEGIMCEALGPRTPCKFGIQTASI